MISRLCQFCGVCIGFIWGSVLRIRRRVVLQNLELAFKNELDSAAKKSLVRKNFRYFGRHLMETLTLPWADKNWIFKNVLMSEEDWHPVRECLNGGRGAFFLMAHLGNWEYGTLYGAFHKVPITIVTKEFKSSLLHKLWFRLRGHPDVQYISASGTALSVVKAIKRGRFVAMMMDQHMQPPVGIESSFFGHRVGTIRSLAMLSLRTGAPVIPLFVVREKDNHYHLYTDKVLTPSTAFTSSADLDLLVHSMTQQYCDTIEKWVRRYPTQWNWLHRRFKYSYDYSNGQKIGEHPASSAPPYSESIVCK